MSQSSPPKLTGRAFYESIGRPKYIVAPMVDRSEFAWRMLTRSYMSEQESKRLLSYSPMFHARLFGQNSEIRDKHFQPTRESLASHTDSKADRWLDGNTKIDRPLFVQFCANNPDELLHAAKYVAPYCDAVDLNLGCPQGIARNGRYGAFLQEDWDTIHRLINKLHTELSVPVTAKMRILDTKEKTLEYAKMILSAGANILAVHGRRREQKGHNTGVADWTYIRYLRDNLPPDTVIFANGNILNAGDVDACLEATGADGIMSAEGNLSDPTIFAQPPTDPESREYWRGPDGVGGYRLDGVIRRYLDIIWRYVLDKEPPSRKPLFVPSDSSGSTPELDEGEAANEEPPRKKQKKEKSKNNPDRMSPNLRHLQGHMFQLLRPILSTHTHIRDTLSKTRTGDMAGFEKVLSLVEQETKKAMLGGEQKMKETGATASTTTDSEPVAPAEAFAAKYKRPWWVCQPHIRPLPEEAWKKGAMTLKKSEQAKAEVATEIVTEETDQDIKRLDEGDGSQDESKGHSTDEKVAVEELPQTAAVCG